MATNPNNMRSIWNTQYREPLNHTSVMVPVESNRVDVSVRQVL